MIKHNKGAALVMVLLISAILGSMSVLLIVKTKQHTQRIAIAKDFMQAERDLHTDLSHFIFETQTSPYSIMGDSRSFPFSRDSLPKKINLQDIPFAFRNSEFSVQDMGALISFTPLDRGLLTTYLSNLGWPSKQISLFLDTLSDWNDADGLQRINGAETGMYKANGYPLNKPVQTIKELALLANVDPILLNRLAEDKNLLVYSPGSQALDYTPDDLVAAYNTPYDAENILRDRAAQRAGNKEIVIHNYSSGNWIIKVNTGYQQAKSSKMLRLLRRFGEYRPFVLSQWHERAK